MKTVLITGASGMVGSTLVKKWLEESDAELFLLIHKNKIQKSIIDKKPTDSLFKLQNKRLHLIDGDITKADLGLSSLNLANIFSKVDSIFHSAATTQFNLPLNTARLINVKGTKNILDLAKRTKRLERLAFISSAYVAGRRTGKIYENELIHKAGFANSYEQSKYEAEIQIKKCSQDLPIATYRLSTILGDSRSGLVSHFTAPHQALRVMHIGLASMLPGKPEYVTDFIASDYTANTLFSLFNSHFQVGKTFHITAPVEKSYTLREIVDDSYRYMAELDRDWAKRNYPKPSIVNEAAFNLLLNTAQEAGNNLIADVLGALGYFVQQLSLPKQFDLTNTLSALPQYSKKFPDTRAYYPKVIKYCLRTRWGRDV